MHLQTNQLNSCQNINPLMLEAQRSLVQCITFERLLINMKLNFRINTSPERIKAVRKELRRGSEPHPRFYTMVAISTGIAAFGLTMNSTAVVIGAMLVAPLMTPIFGIALSLVRGDAKLLGRSVQAEIVGVLLSVGMSIGIGFVIPELNITEEMLSRTAPNLLDFLVAIFAGTAGAYAMIAERISPRAAGCCDLDSYRTAFSKYRALS